MERWVQSQGLGPTKGTEVLVLGADHVPMEGMAVWLGTQWGVPQRGLPWPGGAFWAQGPGRWAWLRPGLPALSRTPSGGLHFLAAKGTEEARVVWASAQPFLPGPWRPRYLARRSGRGPRAGSACPP